MDAEKPEEGYVDDPDDLLRDGVEDYIDYVKIRIKMYAKR
jgi:hypothetical protein